MARMSAEARGASLRRAGLNPPAPPKDLAREARDLWVSITASKPCDWWMGEGGLRLLRRYVRVSILAEQLHDRLDTVGLDHPDAGDLVKQILSCSTTCGVLAAKLRLNPQTGIERHSGHRFEKGSPKPWDFHPTLGGYAVHGQTEEEDPKRHLGGKAVKLKTGAGFQ